MSRRPTKALKAFAVFVAFAVVQVSIQIGFAEPTRTALTVPLPQDLIVGRLTTTNNMAISVNGASAATGANVLSGAEIETPASVGATINLGALGTVDLAPNTKVRLSFDKDGNLKVTLIVGCVIISANKNTEGELLTEQGSQSKTDKSAGGVIDACFPPGAVAPTVGQGAAASAGAGAGAAGAAGAAAAAPGIGTAATLAIIFGVAGAAIGIPVSFRGQNPSPS